jgi:branched-chain amino acid aminotransferase
MAAVVSVNGRISSEREAVVPVYDHGFLYGEGVYETLRTYNRQPFLFDRHMRRLRASAGAIALPFTFTDDTMLGRVHDTMAAGDLDGESYIRILVTRGVGELTYDPAACPTPTIVIIVKRHVDPPAEVFERGVRVALVSVMRNHPGSVNPAIKSNNLLNNALAMQEGFRRGAYESLMRNYRGEIAECSQSNFFIVAKGEVLTPPVDAGILRGVTRDFILEIAAGAGTPAREAVLRPEDAFAADEAFLTSTTRELAPVVQIDDRVIGTGRPGPVTLALLAAFRRQADLLTRQPRAAVADRTR